MEFTDDVWKKVKRLIDDINKRQAENASSIAKKQSQIDAAGYLKKC